MDSYSCLEIGYISNCSVKFFRLVRPVHTAFHQLIPCRLIQCFPQRENVSSTRELNNLEKCLSLCADPGIFAKKSRPSSDNFFLILNLFHSLTEGFKWLFKKNYNFPKFQRGPTFSSGGGGPIFSRGGGGSKC